MGNFAKLPNQQRATMERMMARSEQQSGPIQFLPTSALTPNLGQPRHYFDDQELNTLTESIRLKGILQPLLVRPMQNSTYQIVAGERRWRAAKEAGLDTVPVFVRLMTDDEAREAALIENLERSDLNRFDEVTAKVELIALALGVAFTDAPAAIRALYTNPDEQLEQIQNVSELLARIGNRETLASLVNNGLPVLNLPASLSDALRAGRIEYTKALVISRAPEKHHHALLAQSIQEQWSINTLREQVKMLQTTLTRERSSLEEVRAILTPKTYKGLSASRRSKIDQHLAEILALMQQPN